MRTLEKLDKYLLAAVTFVILSVVVINFITSYGHIYSEGMSKGEYGVDARLMPIGIDGMLLALAFANVFAARFSRNHWLLRVALGFGVAGTIAANGAYGAHWGMTGGLLAVWSPVALFITVESGLFMFRVAADVAAQQPRRGRPPGSKNRAPRAPKANGLYTGGSEVSIPVIRGRVDPLDPFEDLRTS